MSKDKSALHHFFVAACLGHVFLSMRFLFPFLLESHVGHSPLEEEFTLGSHELITNVSSRGAVRQTVMAGGSRKEDPPARSLQRLQTISSSIFEIV